MSIKEEAELLANSMAHCECGLCIDSNKEKIETSLQEAFRAGMLKAAEVVEDRATKTREMFWKSEGEALVRAANAIREAAEKESGK